MKIEDGKYYPKSMEEAACFGGAYLDEHMAATYSNSHMPEPVSLEMLREAITPTEGDAVFYWKHSFEDDWSPVYTCNPEVIKDGVVRYGWPTVKANALTIGQTVGKLRELLRLVKEA